MYVNSVRPIISEKIYYVKFTRLFSCPLCGSMRQMWRKRLGLRFNALPFGGHF